MKLSHSSKIIGLFTIVALLILIFFGGAHFHKDQIWPFGQGYYLVIKDIKKYGINYKEIKKIAEQKRKAEEKKKRIVEQKRKAEEKKKRIAEQKRKAEEKKKRIAEQEARLKVLDECNISRSYDVKMNSHAFIGHAYGKHRYPHENNHLSPEAGNFISKHSSKLSSLIFTGDVFQKSSAYKWKQLRFQAGEDMNILVARGNHDNKAIFKESEYGQHSFPLLTSLNDIPLIVDDSASHKGGVVQDETIELANNVESNSLLIARHHIPISNIIPLANGRGSNELLPSVEDLVNKFNKDKMYYWIIGDGGAFRHLPRLSCLKYQNHIFLTNGLGQVEGDSIILLHNKELSEYVISSEVLKIETLK